MPYPYYFSSMHTFPPRPIPSHPAPPHPIPCILIVALQSPAWQIEEFIPPPLKRRKLANLLKESLRVQRKKEADQRQEAVNAAEAAAKAAAEAAAAAKAAAAKAAAAAGAGATGAAESEDAEAEDVQAEAESL